MMHEPGLDERGGRHRLLQATWSSVQIIIQQPTCRTQHLCEAWASLLEVHSRAWKGGYK
jgi:hypothetical protein